MEPLDSMPKFGLFSERDVNESYFLQGDMKNIGLSRGLVRAGKWGEKVKALFWGGDEEDVDQCGDCRIRVESYKRNWRIYKEELFA